MTLETFSAKFNLSTKDMLEVLKFMGYFKPDYSDWVDELYNNNVVSDLNTINDTKKLKKDLINYKNILTDYYLSRSSKTHNDLKKIMIKNKIHNSESLMNFIRS